MAAADLQNAEDLPPKSVAVLLGRIALGLQALVMFFVTLVIFGKDLLPPWAAWGGGLFFMLLLLVAAGRLEKKWAWYMAWVLQVAFLGLGFIESMIFVVAIFFVGLWLFCVIRGGQVDKRIRESNSK